MTALALPLVVREALGRIGRGSVGIVSQNVLNLGALLYLWHALDAGSYGEVGLALLVSVQACAFLQWGINPLLTRDLVRSSPDDARRLLGASLRQKQLAALFVLAGGLTLAAMPSVPGGPLLIYLGLVDGAILGFTSPPAFDSRGRMATYLAIAHLRPATYLAGLVSLHSLAPDLFVPRAIVLVHAASFVPPILLEWRWIRKHWGPPDTAEAGSGGLRLWTLAAPIAVGEMALQAGNAFSPWAAQLLGQPREVVGHLAASNQLAVAMASLAVVPAAVIHAQLSADRSPGTQAFSRRVLVITLALLAVGIVVAALAMGVASFASPRLPGKHSDALALFRIDAWRFVATLGSAAITSALICRHRVRTYAACQVAGLAMASVAALILVPAIGAPGAAGSLLIGRVAFVVTGLAAVMLAGRSNPR
jgi:hypothetical protein